MRDIARSSGRRGQASKEMDAMAVVMEEAGIKGAWAPDYDKDAAATTEMQMFDTTEEYDQAISDTIEMAADMADTSSEIATGVGAAIGAGLLSIIPGVGTAVGLVAGGTIGGLIGSLFGGEEEARSFFEEMMQSDLGDDLAKAMAGDQDARERLLESNRGFEAWSKVGEMFGDDASKMKAVGLQLGKVSQQRFGRARLKTMRRTSKMAARELQAGVQVKGEAGEKLTQLLETYGGTDYAGGSMQAESKARRLAQELIESDDLKELAEKGGAVGRSIAQLGKQRRQLGRLKTGDVSMEQLEAQMQKMGGAIPEGMKEELREMVESGGEFTTEEKTRFQEMFSKRAARGEVVGGGTMAARKAGTDRLTELLTSYTEANTKFVFAVGAAMQDVDVKDLQEKAVQMRREVNAAANPVGARG
jgi:hypothetical protein